MAKKINWLLVIKHRSESGRRYTVRLARSQSYCTCPAWRFQKVHPAFRNCKHIGAVKAELRSVGIAA